MQQFFEALGLTKPPRLQMRDQDVKLSGAPAAPRHVLQVTTTDNKVIFVHASSNESWLSTGRVQVKGATANVPIECAEVPDKPGQPLSARVIVTGNGNQTPSRSSIAEGGGRPGFGDPGRRRRADPRSCRGEELQERR